MRHVLIGFFICLALTASAGEIHRAAEKGDLSVVKNLLRKNKSLLNEKDSTGRTPFHYAVISENQKLIIYLIKQGADVYAIDKDGYTALHLSMFWDSSTAAFLLQNGVKPTLSSRDGRSILCSIASDLWDMYSKPFRPTVEMIDELLASPNDVQSRNSRGQTPLHYAAYYGHTELAARLLAHGAEINAEDEDRYTPLNYAIDDKRFMNRKDMLACGNEDISEMTLNRHRQGRSAVADYLRSVGGTANSPR